MTEAGPLRRPLLVGWALACLVLCLTMADSIRHLWFTDPDDAMRLLQARDWLAGQSWWDVGQHRLNGGDFSMHWSRVVDLPLAAGMLVLDPLIGEALSDRVVMTLVPLGTLLAIMGLAAALTRATAGEAAARLAILLVPLSTPLVQQVRPLRIDHHGWQIALALAAALTLFGPATWKRGAAAGIALGALLTISLEGLPITAAIMGVAALAWAVRPQRGAFLFALGWGVAVTVTVLHMATRGPDMWREACDAVSPAYVTLFLVAATTLTVVCELPAERFAARIASLALAGAASGAALAVVTPACLRGPFATLDPLVRQVWYLNVAEGLPIWRQTPAWGLTCVALPIVGLIGAGLALRRAEGEARWRWLLLLGLMGCSLAIALLVARAAATANALAIPGAAWVLGRLLARARTVKPVGGRVLATAGALLSASPGLLVGMAGSAAALVRPPQSVFKAASRHPACSMHADVRGLAELPPGTVFAPLDISPDLIATTRHKAIASGYHRNADAMRRVIAAFTGTPEEARRIIEASGADYLAGCPQLYEPDVYREIAPDGFWAQLDGGKRFPWLQPVRIRSTPVLAWRVVRRPLSDEPSRP